MDNLKLRKEDIEDLVLTECDNAFLEKNELRIKGWCSYELSLKREIKELGKLACVILQGKPGGTLSKVKFARVSYGVNSEGKHITPFGVVYFEEEEGK